MGKYDTKIAKIKTALENVFVKIKQNTGNQTLSTDANGNVILEAKNNHAHGQITKDGKISSDISSVNKIVVTDGSTIARTINKLPADKVTHQDISGKSNVGHTHNYLEPTSEITSGNLDNYTEPGIWVCTGDNYLNLTGTKPFTQKAAIIIQNIKYKSNIVVQFIYPVHSSTNINHIYKRIYNNTWGDWINITDDSKIPTKVSQLTNDSGFLTSHQDISGKANSADLAIVATTGSYNDLSDKPAPTTIASNTNLNTYIEPGEYICNTTTIAKTLTHTPWGDSTSTNAVAFNMQVHKTGQASGKVMISQIIHDYNGNNTYTRTCYANTANNAYLTTGWSTWESFAKNKTKSIIVNYTDGTTETINFLIE